MVEFPREMRGYKRSAVEREMIRLESAVTEAGRQLAEQSDSLRKTRLENEQLKSDLGRQYHDQEEISSALLSAQKVADEVRRTAQEEAESLRRSVQDEASTIRQQAHNAASETLTAARQEAGEILAKARGEALLVVETAHEKAEQIDGAARESVIQLQFQIRNLRTQYHQELRRAAALVDGLSREVRHSLMEMSEDTEIVRRRREASRARRRASWRSRRATGGMTFDMLPDGTQDVAENVSRRRCRCR